MDQCQEIESLKEVLNELHKERKILIAILYGSYAKGEQHCRSDIDLALYLNVRDEDEEMEIIDKILMSVEPQVSILRLDDEDESPFIIQEALKGIHLVDPAKEALYAVSHRALHECEGIRFRRGMR